MSLRASYNLWEPRDGENSWTENRGKKLDFHHLSQYLLTTWKNFPSENKLRPLWLLFHSGQIFLNPMNSSTFPELGKRSLLFFLKKIQDAAITSHLMRPLVCRVWHLEGKWKKCKNTFSWSRSEIPADRFHDKATNVTAATSLEDSEHCPRLRRVNYFASGLFRLLLWPTTVT